MGMKRFLLLALLACGPALANDRAESEARLAALSDQVISALGAALPLVDGMICQPGAPDKSPANRMFVPNWRADCRWAAGGADAQTTVTVVLSTSAVDVLQAQMARDQKTRVEEESTNIFKEFFGQPKAEVMLTARDLKATPSESIVIMAPVPGDGVSPAPAAMVALAEALAAIDISDLEALPDVQAHKAALAAHRGLLERHRATLAALLMTAVDGKPPTELPRAQDYPDFMFFGAEPLVQTRTDKGGVVMQVTLTTSTFALEAAEEEGRFTKGAVNGDISRGGVYHDRGRVKVYLGEKALTALIDGRGMLIVDVSEVAEGADPLAAMEAVLAGIAAHDFSGF